jgi:membrane associated rhomboid family serine protease
VVATTITASLLLGDQPWAANWRLELSQPFVEQWWTLLSAPFTVPEGRLLALLPHLLTQWWLGGRLEMFWGTKRFLFFVLAVAMLSTLGAGFLGPALSAAGPLGGPTAIDGAILLGFGVVFARETYELPLMSAPMGARPVAAMMSLVVFATASNAFADWPALLGLPGALVVAAAFLWQPWRRSHKTGKLSAAQRAPHLRVVRSADDLLN